MNLVVIGGGTGANSIAAVFTNLPQDPDVCYIVPVSDNGGSTSEILRVIGGPAIGDARSRLVRVMPESGLHELLALRLPADNLYAQHQWTQLVDGTHPVWAGVSAHLRHMYGAFFIHLHAELLKLGLGSARPFDFSSASVGNLLLTAARLFFGSLDAAIEFVRLTTRIDSGVQVLPCISTNSTYHIAARLYNGSVVVGQTDISHPAEELRSEPEIDARHPFSHPRLSTSQIKFSKEEPVPLPSPIDRVFYVNMYGGEIRPRASPRVLESLTTADVIVYSVGSLYTSIVPVLILEGVAEALKAGAKRLVLIQNGSPDRESAGMTSQDTVKAISRACNYWELQSGRFVTHLVYPEGWNVDDVKAQGIVCEPVVCPAGKYSLSDLRRAIIRCINLES